MAALISVAFHMYYTPKVKVRTPNLGGMLIFKRAGQPRCRIRQVLRNLENLFQSENNPTYSNLFEPEIGCQVETSSHSRMLADPPPRYPLTPLDLNHIGTLPYLFLIILTILLSWCWPKRNVKSYWQIYCQEEICFWIKVHGSVAPTAVCQNCPKFFILGLIIALMSLVMNMMMGINAKICVMMLARVLEGKNYKYKHKYDCGYKCKNKCECNCAQIQ